MKPYRTTWNLKLLYKSDTDPQIEKDVIEFEKGCDAIARKYRNKDFTSSPQRLLKILKDIDKFDNLEGYKAWRYYELKNTLNSDDQVSKAAATRLENRLRHSYNKIIFIDLNIGRITTSKQQLYLKSQLLQPYRYSLQKIFDQAKHYLSDGEERIENLLSPSSYTMWVDVRERILNRETIPFKGETLPINKAIMGLQDYPKKDRKILYAKIIEKFKANNKFAEGEINAIFNYKKVHDEIRQYKEPYSSTIQDYEQEDKVVKDIVDLIARNYSIAHRFYKLHARLVGDTMADRQSKIGKIKKKFPFESAIHIVKEELHKIDPIYSDILTSMVKNGQFDVYPRKGKSGGAFCWSGVNKEPAYILLNHVDSIDSIETIAHEMGHAIHGELAKRQPRRYQRYSTAVAETASTFFEQVVSNALENHLSNKERIILLHNKIAGDMAAIFRQVACFNFELELHKEIRSKGQISGERMAAILAKHIRAYTGKSMKVTEDDGYYYVYWSQVRSFFYVYSYAYGQLISRALYEKWKKAPSFSKKIEKFLSAGRSMSPEDIFKSIGINTRDPKFFKMGLKGIEDDIKKLERLTRKK